MTKNGDAFEKNYIAPAVIDIKRAKQEWVKREKTVHSGN